MEFERVGLFHAPILKAKADLDHKEIELYVRSCLSQKESYTSYYDQKFNEEIIAGLPQREELESQMKQLATEYLKLRGAPSRVWEKPTLGYWFSVYKEGDSHTLHNHPGSAVAGTYYPYADESSVPIRFKHPAGNLIQMSEPWNEADVIWHWVSPTSGDMNVWPSWLEHQIGTQGPVDEQRSRIAVSFNFGRS